MLARDTITREAPIPPQAHGVRCSRQRGRSVTTVHTRQAAVHGRNAATKTHRRQSAMSRQTRPDTKRGILMGFKTARSWHE